MGMFKTAITGAAWTTVSTVVRSVVSLLQVSILTRFLEKSDFGIVAIAVLFIGFTSIFLDLGISIGILHKQNISRQEYSSLFWLNIFSGIFLTIILMLFAPIVSNIYNEPDLTPILQLLCLSLFLSSLGNQHRTVQQKKLRFKLISFVEIVSSFITIIVAVLTAYGGYGVYSLVYSSLCASLCPNIIFLLIGLSKDNNIFFHFSLKETLPFLKIGGYSIAGQVLDYFSREMDVMIISATLGKEALGVYSLCKRLVTALYSSVMPIYNKVLVPLISSLQNDVNHARTVIYDIVESVALTNYPIFLLLAIFPGFIINTIYGANYLDSIGVLSLLAIHYGYSSPTNPASSILIAFGRTDLGLCWTIFLTTVFGISSYIGAQFSIEGMVLAILIGRFLLTPINWIITIKPIIGGVFLDYFLKTFKPFILSISLALPFWAVFHKNTDILIIIISVAAYIFIYGFLAYKIFRNSYIIDKIVTLASRCCKKYL